MTRTGRPIAIDEHRRAAIADALARGATVRSLATIAGVSERTLHAYLARGLVARPRAREDGASPKAPPPQADHLDDLLDELLRSHM